MQEESLFLAALDLPTAADRAAFLAQTCGGDARLRERVELLLAADGRAVGILDAAPDTAGPTARPAGPALAAGQPFAGRYVLVRKLGVGGMGEVWAADQTAPVRRPVALKVLRPDFDPTAVVARFEQERQALAVMDHPNIARVFDAGVAGGLPYLAMELVEGVPVTAHCDARQRTVRQRLELFVPVCHAVQHAHQKGVIHRDLKPANVLVAEVDGRPAPKVIDFGIAKAAGAKLTDSTLHTGHGAILGTLEYMAPEQAGGGADVDTRADIYALGVILYELLTGTTPIRRADYAAGGVFELLRAVREDEPPPPSRRAGLATVSGDLDWVVMKCLEKDRGRRYDTAAGLARDLQRYLADEVVEARPPSAGYRMRKFVRRNRPQVLAAAAVLVAVVAGAAVATWQAIRATAAEWRAVDDRDAMVLARQSEAEEAAVTRAVQAFLQEDLLGQADVRNQGLGAGRNPNITVRRVLDRAAARIAGRFADRPRTEAAVRFTVGSAYRALGEFAAAEVHLKRCLELRVGLWPEDHPDVLATAATVGELFVAQNRLPEADELLTRTLDRYDRAGLGGLDNALLCALNLARVHAARDRFEAAEALYRRCLNGFRDRYTDRHQYTLFAMSGLGRLYRERGRPEAVELLTRVMDLAVEVLGRDDPGTLAATVDVARLYREGGRLDDAERVSVRVLELAKVVHPPDHPDVSGAMLALAQVYNAQRKYDRAEPLLKQALEQMEARFRKDDDRVLVVVNSLAVTHLRRGRAADAVPLFRRVKDAWQDRHGSDHRYTLIAQNNLATACEEAGQGADAVAAAEAVAWGLDAKRFEVDGADEMMADAAGLLDRAGRANAADDWRRKWVDAVRRRSGRESVDYAAALADLGASLLRQRKWDSADPVLRECLAIRERVRPDDWTTFDTKVLLGTTQLGRRQFTEAESQLLAGYAGLKAREKDIPPAGRGRLAVAAGQLAELYDIRGDAAAAARWRAEREQYPPPSEPGPPPRLVKE